MVESAMLGYLNAPNPFTNDGWFNTGDKVEVDGEYFRTDVPAKTLVYGVPGKMATIFV